MVILKWSYTERKALNCDKPPEWKKCVEYKLVCKDRDNTRNIYIFSTIYCENMSTIATDKH